MADTEPQGPTGKGMLRRGVKQRSPAGIATFVGLRFLDPLWQYQILRHGVAEPLLHKLGLNTLPAGAPAQTGFAPIDSLQLSPYRLVLLAMSVAAAAKHSYWVGVTSEEEFGPAAAATVSAFNTVMNSLNTVLFTTTFASASLDTDANFPQWPLLVGSTLFTVGLLTETVAETQRKAFKSKPENKGKVCTTGLWGIVRHINYTGYTLWRTGFALTAGGWVWGTAIAALFLSDFNNRSIPELDGYCSERVSLDCQPNTTEQQS